jgi:hypothetical protein
MIVNKNNPSFIAQLPERSGINQKRLCEVSFLLGGV